MTTEPATPAEPKRGFPWWRVGLLASAVLVVLIVVPFYRPIEVKTGPASWLSFRAHIVPTNNPVPYGVSQVKVVGRYGINGKGIGLRLVGVIWVLSREWSSTNSPPQGP